MTEKIVHKQICKYLSIAYPSVIYRTDYGAGLKMTIGQAKQMKALQSPGAYPDLFIAEPKGGYHGLYLEIKKDLDVLFTKKLELRKNEHIQDQAEMIERLNDKGYLATFVWGFDRAKEVIDRYMNDSISTYSIEVAKNTF